jgi:hypothetical protein
LLVNIFSSKPDLETSLKAKKKVPVLQPEKMRLVVIYSNARLQITVKLDSEDY